jgi:DNA invertase Pin-like site-specific DNA recombinase
LRYVAYFRVSTQRQGRSGLGLEAQQKAVADHINGNGSELVGTFTEIESGKIKNRPELGKALAACRKHKAKLIVAKLDRLGRNVAFIAQLMDSGVEFVAADMPEANTLTLHIMAAMAQYEREAISTRTKAALAAAKARGVKLGNPDITKLAVEGREIQAAAADQRAANVKPIIAEIKAAGLSSLRQIAAALNARGITTARGGVWHPQTVARVMAR